MSGRAGQHSAAATFEEAVVSFVWGCQNTLLLEQAYFQSPWTVITNTLLQQAGCLKNSRQAP